MTKRQVWQYWCSFCGKHNLSAASIAKHEKHCTANPERVCRMCQAQREAQRSLADLLACIDISKPDQGLQDLRDLCASCPACILAALRMSDAHKPGYTLSRGDQYSYGAVDDDALGPRFNFKAECESWWENYNNAKVEQREYCW